MWVGGAGGGAARQGNSSPLELARYRNAVCYPAGSMCLYVGRNVEFGPLNDHLAVASRPRVSLRGHRTLMFAGDSFVRGRQKCFSMRNDVTIRKRIMYFRDMMTMMVLGCSPSVSVSPRQFSVSMMIF